MSNFFKPKNFAKSLIEQSKEAMQKVEGYVEKNKGDWQRKVTESIDITAAATESGRRSAAEAAQNFYWDVRYPKTAVRDLQKNIEYQGGYYRELLKTPRVKDTIFIGGESLATLLSEPSVPPAILMAYESAYPNMSEIISFQDRVRELEGNQLLGFVSGIKGKLFEQKYIEYLNSGNLPEGYTALLADSANQVGWDIKIVGPNHELTNVLQAKATDSLSYVADAISRYPDIDVVTTEEVFSHLVLNGISEGISNSEISNADLAEQLENAIDSAGISMNFVPPLFTLAFIAFTSYKNESLTLYEKAQSAGDRSGKAYLSFLIGGSVAVVTNTWWLGVLGSVSSRYMSDEGLKKRKVIERLSELYRVNGQIIDRIKGISSGYPKDQTPLTLN